jgi:hypothetical protein
MHAGALKAARRARDLDALRETVYAVKLCGFAPFARDEVAKAAKLAEKLEKQRNKEDANKRAGLVQLSI